MCLHGTPENDCPLSESDGESDATECDSLDEEEFEGEKEPFVGMEFNTLDEAFEFYKSYAGRRGFSIRKHSKTKNKSGLSSRRFVCTKEGFSERQKQKQVSMGTNAILRTPEKKYSSTRCGCKAYIRFCRENDRVWKVSAYNDEHNHDLIVSPSKNRNLNILKNITQEEKQTILKMRAQNVGSSQIWNYLGEDVGGCKNLRFNKKDVSNMIAEQNRILVGVDVETTMTHFRKRQEDDPDFYYAIEGDETGATKNIFWVDGRARRAYLEFGDVVTFDTTYNTNKYAMPVGVFIGVNHHWQSIIFGFCLLRNEKASNFSWSFTTWLAAMYNKAPKSIITDQDPAMKSAIAEVFPATVHRCCQWHVMRKAREHLGVLYNKEPGFKKELEDVINRSLTVVDFEKSWKQMINKYQLKENKHLKVMYRKRAEWVPAYFRGVFFAGMSTTQRSETANHVMKLWVDGHACIYRFVQQAEKIVEGIWQKESDEDYRTINETPTLQSLSNIEVEARQVYTARIFKKFKEIMYNSTNGVVVEIEKDKLYQVNITCHPKFPHWVPESHQVWVDKPNSTISCNCKGFEFLGLLCPHAIKVMQYVGIQKLPSRYVLKRWTKGANDGAKGYRSMDMEKSGELQAMRFASIQPKLIEFAKLVSKSDSVYRLFETEFEKLKENILLVMDQESDEEVYKEPVVGGSIPTPLYRDPPLSQCKGRKKKLSRIKPSIEKTIKKRRTCSYCLKQEGHNRASCPKKKQDQEVREGKKKQDKDDGSKEDDLVEEDDSGKDDDLEEEDGSSEDDLEEEDGSSEDDNSE